MITCSKDDDELTPEVLELFEQMPSIMFEKSSQLFSQATENLIDIALYRDVREASLLDAKKLVPRLGIMNREGNFIICHCHIFCSKIS